MNKDNYLYLDASNIENIHPNTILNFINDDDNKNTVCNICYNESKKLTLCCRSSTVDVLIIFAMIATLN